VQAAVLSFKGFGANTCASATGTKSISAMCRAIVFRLVPTSLEIVAVVSVLSRMFRPEVGAIVAATSLTYIAFTAAMTKVCCLCTRVVQLCVQGASAGSSA
jgi:ABC-type transport system involved in Fe-S cluster assembly fused permease/ATPase subunit